MVLFGRAALALGFGDGGEKFGATKDVDAILPSLEMAKIETDEQFWKAIEVTNRELESSGLYLTHLFTDKQLVLTSDWADKISSIPSDNYRFLRLFRPCAIDLILTKMMRNDPQDLDDIRFIMTQQDIAPSSLSYAFKSVLPIEVPEIDQIFVGMQPVVLKIALEIGSIDRGKSAPEGPTRSLDADWWSKLNEPPQTEPRLEKDREIEL